MAFYDAGTTNENGETLNFHYQIARFVDGSEFYQEINANGEIVRFTDMDGNTVTPSGTDYSIPFPNPPRPSWGT